MRHYLHQHCIYFITVFHSCAHDIICQRFHNNAKCDCVHAPSCSGVSAGRSVFPSKRNFTDRGSTDWVRHQEFVSCVGEGLEVCDMLMQAYLVHLSHALNPENGHAPILISVSTWDSSNGSQSEIEAAPQLGITCCFTLRLTQAASSSALIPCDSTLTSDWTSGSDMLCFFQ